MKKDAKIYSTHKDEIFGYLLEPGDILTSTDVFKSKTGYWEPCPCSGIYLSKDSTTVWVRPSEIQTINWDWKSSPKLRNLQKALSPFGLFVIEDPCFANTDHYGFAISNKPFEEKDLKDLENRYEEDL